MTINDCRQNYDYDEQVVLERLIERMNRLTSMARPKYRDEESKVRILREETMGTECLLRESGRVTDRKSYQSLISALNCSQRDLNLHTAAMSKQK